MKIRFLLDEHLKLDIIDEVQAFDPSIDILHIGMKGAPPIGTQDPDILIYCEAEQRALVTDNRRTMPKHAADHFAAGRHHWGVLVIRPDTTWGEIVQELRMFGGASEAEEWIDRVEYIPY